MLFVFTFKCSQTIEHQTHTGLLVYGDAVGIFSYKRTFKSFQFIFSDRLRDSEYKNRFFKVILIFAMFPSFADFDFFFKKSRGCGRCLAYHPSLPADIHA